MDPLNSALDPAGGLRTSLAKTVSKTITFTGLTGAGALAASATLATALTGANNDLDFTATGLGNAGNSTTIRYVDPGTAGAALAVTVSGTAVTVSLATSAAVAATGTITSDATNPTNNDTFVLGAKTYKTVTTLTEVKASGTLTSDATNPTNGETMTIGTRTYTFVTTLSGAADEILIGAAATNTLDNIKSAINATAGAGTTYGTGTAINNNVTATTKTATTLLVVAVQVGVLFNSIGTFEASAHLSWGAATLTGGVDSIANEIVIGAAATNTLDNMKSAINGTAGAGTTYSSATVAHTVVSATTKTATTLLIVAAATGTGGNAIVFTEASTHLSMDGSGVLGGTTAGSAGAVITSTAGQVKTAFDAVPAAAALVPTTANHAGNDGTGIVTAMAATALAGGADGTIPLFTVRGQSLVAPLISSTTVPAGATGTIVVGYTGTTNALVASIVGTTIVANRVVDTTGLVTANAAIADTPLRLVNDGQNIFATIGTAALTAGVLTFTLFYRPITAGALISAV